MAVAWPALSRLWLVLDRAAAAPRSLLEVTRQAVAGGIDVVVCRIKDATPDELRKLARPLRELCRQSQIPFVLSHCVDVALELGADAVQLGVSAGALDSIRATLSPEMLIGYSTHSVPEASLMLEQGADYVFLGPIFPTPAKLHYGQPLGLGVVQPALALAKPVVFIGGINPATLPELTALGVTRIAAIAALQSVPDVTRAVRGMRRALEAR